MLLKYDSSKIKRANAFIKIYKILLSDAILNKIINSGRIFHIKF